MYRTWVSLMLLLTTPALVVADERIEKGGLWNLTSLKTHVPKMAWLRQDVPVHSLTYEGEQFEGHTTDVFAFYASPTTLGEAESGEKFPGVVLIHGGGGTAFAEWAYLWAKRGYAAIAMDLAGSRPPDPQFDPRTGAPVGHQSDAKLRTRLPRGGPDHGHGEKFDSIGGDTSDDWPFHAAASVIRAHTLLRSFPEVDAENTAVTGISWGGYTTCLVASLDDRFKAAVPVYGCGFLHEGESVQKPSIDRLGERRSQWVKEYDPGSLLPRCRVPILFVNGTNDKHYCLDSYMKSFEVVPGPKQLCVTVNMPHSHTAGWAPREIGMFIDSKCRRAKPLPIPDVPTVDSDHVHVQVTSETKLKKAELHFTTDVGLRAERNWTTVAANIVGDSITTPLPPPNANTWFVTIVDERDAVVSTTVQFSSPHQARRGPVKVIFDTDISGDVDDVLALAMLHTLADRGECELLAVTISKINPLTGPFVDAVNTFYGRGEIPIGVTHDAQRRDSKYLALVQTRDGDKFRYPHDVQSNESLPDGVALLRKTLAAADDGSVVLVQVGLAANLAGLTQSQPDEYSSLSGKELIREKVYSVSVMAGAFSVVDGNSHFLEANVRNGIRSMQQFAQHWPHDVPVIWSDFLIGVRLAYPRESIRDDFGYREHHIVPESYLLHSGPEHDRPTWDLTSVLYAVRPDHGYFGLSEAGFVRVDDDGYTSFEAAVNGRDRYLTLSESEQPRAIEALRSLVSQPPSLR